MVSSTGKLSVLADASVVHIYVLLFAHVYIEPTVVPGTIFHFGTCTFVHDSLLYKNQPGKVANPARGQLAEQGK